MRDSLQRCIADRSGYCFWGCYTKDKTLAIGYAQANWGEWFEICESCLKNPKDDYPEVKRFIELAPISLRSAGYFLRASRSESGRTEVLVRQSNRQGLYVVSEHLPLDEALEQLGLPHNGPG